MRNYLIALVVLLALSIWSFFYLIAGSAIFTLILFAVSSIGFAVTLASFIGHVVLKFISRWKRK
jgi:hypothetical protein